MERSKYNQVMLQFETAQADAKSASLTAQKEGYYSTWVDFRPHKQKDGSVVDSGVWLNFTHALAGTFVWNTAFPVHLLLLLSLLVVVFAVFMRKKFKIRHSLSALIMLVPAWGYWFSVILASPVPDYRYIYPLALVLPFLVVAVVRVLMSGDRGQN
jgi:hypothetical protein